MPVNFLGEIFVIKYVNHVLVRTGNNVGWSGPAVLPDSFTIVRDLSNMSQI